jgi:pentatricopeptide repeat protein
MVEERWTPNVIVYIVLIQDLCSNGILEKVVSVLAGMERSVLMLEYSILIDGFSKIGDVHGAVNVWHMMDYDDC